MVLKEYKRLLKSKQSLIIAILFIIGAISFYMSFCEKQMFVEMLHEDFSSDLNRENLTRLVNNYNGIQFMFNYWFSSDFAQITIYVLYVWVGIFMTPNLLLQKEDGFGNLVMTRTPYKVYVKNNVLAQTLYIFTVVAVASVLQLILALAWGGVTGGTSIGSYELTVLEVALVIVVQVVSLTLYVSFVNGICMMCSTFVKNKYVLQALPLIVFAIIPMLTASTLGNLSEVFASVIIYFDAHNVSVWISNIFQSFFDAKEILYNVFPLVIYGLIFALLARVNVKTNERNYV